MKPIRPLVDKQDVVAVDRATSVAQAARLMSDRHVGAVPVIDGERLVGIVSRANLVRALVDNLPKPAPAGAASDAEIRERILAEIDRQPWGPRASVDVRVEGGIVELYGSITDDRERTALQVVAENIPGVKAVHDNLVWVEPISGLVIPTPGSEPPAGDSR